MVETINVKKVEGVLYFLIIKTIRSHGLVDNFSGEIYISHSNLRYVLGKMCRVPYNSQMKVIQELICMNALIVCKVPSSYLGHLKGGEIFYLLNKDIVEE